MPNKTLRDGVHKWCKALGSEKLIRTAMGKEVRNGRTDPAYKHYAEFLTEKNFETG